MSAFLECPLISGFTVLISSFILPITGELYSHPKRPIDIAQSNIACTKGACVMKQTTQNALQIIDCHGNQFEVDADGSYRVQKAGHFQDGKT